MSDYLTFGAECAELALAGFGCLLLWRLVLAPAARARRHSSPLPAWDASPADFLVFLLYVTCGGFFAAVIASLVTKPLGLSGDARVVFYGGIGQLGLLGGVVLHRSTFKQAWLPVASNSGNVFASGAATFLMALPLLIGASKLWEALLHALGLPAQKQNLIEVFVHADSPVMLAVLVLLATIIAPITEELIFRAGLFRYFRTRLPRWLAFLLPALVFASLHVDNWKTLDGFSSFAPLVVLAMLFSAGYERTGRIGTPMVAHALFNLNTMLLIFAGVAE